MLFIVKRTKSKAKDWKKVFISHISNKKGFYPEYRGILKTHLITTPLINEQRLLEGKRQFNKRI